MKTVALILLLAFAAAPLLPAEAAYACHGSPERVAVCESWGGGANCFDVYVQNERVIGPCLA